MMDKKKKILIVEDHALTSFALKTTLNGVDYIDSVFEASNAQDGYKILKNEKIDLILMDLGLPDINGVDAIHEIKKKYPKVKIIVLTSHCEKDEVMSCLEVGINAYCSKEIRPEKLTDVIKDILSGSIYYDSCVSGYVMEHTKKLNIQTFNSINVKDCYNLTQQEKRVLILLSSGNNNQQIAKKLKVSINTIKVHVCSILQKMKVEDRTQAAIKAIREGLIE